MATRAPALRALGAEGFVFATGIECSYPTITGRDGRRTRIDQLEKSFHYRRWRDDLALVEDLGIRYLRYGPPYYRMHLGPDRYDWTFADEVCGDAPAGDRADRGPVPLRPAGLARGLPEPGPAGALHGVRPRVRPALPLGAPVHPGQRDLRLRQAQRAPRAVERAAPERARFRDRPQAPLPGELLAVDAILGSETTPFVQSESAEYFHQGCQEPAMVARADFENQRRFLSFDLLYAHPVCAAIRRYLRECGLTDAEYSWFMERGRPTASSWATTSTGATSRS